MGHQLSRARRERLDASLLDHDHLVPADVPAGSVAYFGSLLVHWSLPNRLARDRRALLYRYQRAGLPHASELANRTRRGTSAR